MMRGLIEHGRAVAARRVAEIVDALVETAEAELPDDMTVERRDDGIAIGGRRLARRLAYDGRLRGLTLLLTGRGR